MAVSTSLLSEACQRPDNERCSLEAHMTDRDTPGAKWFREDKERRAKEAAEQERAAQRKRLETLVRMREAKDRERQEAVEAPADPAQEERALMSRIMAEPDPRARERLEGQLQGLRARMKRDAGRAARRRPPSGT
jgi:hypothetical protein